MVSATDWQSSETRAPAARLSEAVWSEMLGRFRAQHPDLVHAGMAGLKAPTLDRGELVLEAADAALFQHLDQHCKPGFTDVAQGVTGRLVTVRFVLAETSPVAPRLPVELRSAAPWLNGDYVFEHFVTGPENRFAHATCRAAAESPGRAYNPLFLHGSPGLGKTHLLQAICHQVLADRPGARVAYLTCETFVNEFIEAVRLGDVAEFRRRYREMDLLAVDDMQFLSTGERSQEEFFHTFNAIHQGQRQIVLSADCPPGEIPNLTERLVSRFLWGLVVRLDPLSLETRIAILRTKAKMKCIAAPDDALSVLGSAVKGNARELEGALLRLKAESEMAGEPIDAGLTRRMLGGGAGPSGPVAVEVSLARILNEVAERFNVKPPEVRGRRRHRSVALARQACMYLARRITNHSLEEIGGYLGRRDHSTVLHAQRTIAQRRAADSRLDGLLGEIEQQLLHGGTDV